MHGLGSNPRRFAMLVRNYPGRARFVLPRAPDPYGPQGYSWFPLTRPLHRPPKATLNHMLKSADRLAALIRELQADHPNTPKPIIMGFSQGGLMSYAVATRHPQLIRAALPISGWLPDAMVPTQAPNFTPLIWSMHGTSDTVVPELPTRTMVDTLKALHFQVEYTSWPNVGHTISQDMRHALFEQLDTLLAQESPP
ncbi:MAG: dienelactone hydrolase family protein [Myxococcota bacterium]